MKRSTRWRVAGVFSTLVSPFALACGGLTLVGVSGSGSTTEMSSSTSLGSSSSTEGSTTSTSSSTGATVGSGSSSSTTGCGFLNCSESDGADDPPTCDAFAQDCPDGYKCTLRTEDGSSWWGGTRCVMVDPKPQAPGDVCVSTGSLTGVDNCELGAFCWDVDAETHEGVCLAFCAGSPYEPVCPPAHLCQSLTRGGVNAGLCLPNCDPIESDCAGDDLCIPSGEDFICVLDASGEAGHYGDPCEYANACKAGLYCLNPEYVDGCQAAGCCTPFCDTSEPPMCPGATQVCIPWYEEGMAPPGYEHVGICGIPQ